MQSPDVCMGVLYNEWQYDRSFSATLVDVFLLMMKDKGMLPGITVKW